MYTQAEIKRRISYLQNISPAGATNVINELATAISSYYQRDEEFEKLVRRTLMRVVSDAFSRHIKVEHEELLPPLPEHCPRGYLDVTVIFGGNVFKEIMEIDDESFKSAFKLENSGGGNGSGGGTVIWKNSYVTSWLAEISSLKESETAALEKIGDFCITWNEDRGLALIFEELGWIKTDWTRNKRGLAKNVYLTRGYAWVIDNFILNIFEPSYLGELR